MITITLKLEGKNQEVLDTMKNFLNSLEQKPVIETSIQVPVVMVEEPELPLFIEQPKFVNRRVLSYKKRRQQGKQILAMKEKGKTIKEISQKYNMSRKQTSNILYYERNVRPKLDAPILPEVETFPNPTERDLRNLQIVELHRSGMMPVELGNKFNLHPSTVSTLCWRAKKEGWY